MYRGLIPAAGLGTRPQDLGGASILYRTSTNFKQTRIENTGAIVDNDVLTLRTRCGSRTDDTLESTRLAFTSSNLARNDSSPTTINSDLLSEPKA